MEDPWHRELGETLYPTEPGILGAALGQVIDKVLVELAACVSLPAEGAAIGAHEHDILVLKAAIDHFEHRQPMERVTVARSVLIEWTAPGDCSSRNVAMSNPRGIDHRDAHRL